MTTERTDWQETGEGRMSDAQRRLLNAALGDIAQQVRWHGFRLTKDDYRHLFSGTVLGWRTMPAYDNGDGRQGVIMLGGSSLDLSKSQATDAITMAFQFGDDPESQGCGAKPVRWCAVVCMARWIVAEVAA